MIGPTILQGPHHAAQKSTITGLSLFSTVSSKLESVISKAIIFVFQLCFYCKFSHFFLHYLQALYSNWLFIHYLLLLIIWCTIHIPLPGGGAFVNSTYNAPGLLQAHQATPERSLPFAFCWPW